MGKKILINTPDLKLLGGVSNHYLGLKDYWTSDVHYNTIGTRSIIPGLLILPIDIIKFILKCVILKPTVLILNPSLGDKALKRDAIYLNISKVLNIKTVVFFHGWDKLTESKISDNPNWFIKNYNKANGFLVLAQEFKSKLIEWGIQSNINLTTTKVDDNLLLDFEFKHKPINPNILFLARIEKAKGIYIVIDSFVYLKNKYPKLKLTISGDGSELINAKQYVIEKGVMDINFTGRISGESLKKVFKNNGIYFLPTIHGEGMPTSILEAMAFGQAIVTRPVGGIKDFFENKKMGFMLDSINHQDYIEKLSYLIENQDKLNDIGNYNYQYSKNNFMASQVAKNIENSIKEILINKNVD